MITDEQTNKVYFSEHLTAYKCWKNIEIALREHNVPFGFLPGTKDIWARDFMPIQKGQHSFLGYEYNPDYLQNEQEYITRNVRGCYDFSHKYLTVLDAIIDGGNVIKCGNKIIMTDKVFVENKDKDREEFKEYLEEILACELVIIPWDKEEVYGHSDGMVRYVEPGHVVINHYFDFDKSLRMRILNALEPHFDNISELHYGDNARVKSWAHINFLRVGNTIFVPQMGVASDTMAIEQLQDIYSKCKIVPVEVDGVVKKGGALNCISWNIKE